MRITRITATPGLTRLISLTIRFFIFLFFFAFAAGTFWPVFCTTLLSPARWIFYEPGNVGFCVEDWNINMAVAPRAPLSRSDTKAFIRLSRLGKFLLEQCSSHLPAFIAGHASRIRGCNGLSNARCKFCHLLDHKAGQMPHGKSDFLWKGLFFMSDPLSEGLKKESFLFESLTDCLHSCSGGEFP